MLTLANAFGFVVAHLRYFVIGGTTLVLIIAVMFTFRSCKKPAKLDEKAIAEAQRAVEEHNDEKLKEVLANADVKEKVIAGEVANAQANTEAAKVEAKKKYDAMNTQELQDEFNRQAGIK